MNFNDYINEFDAYIKNKIINSDEDFDRAFDEFMKSKGILSSLDEHPELSEENAEDVYDYLELSDNASTKKQALKYAKQALALEPDNWDAETRVIELSAGNSEILINKYKKLIDKANRKMQKDGWFSDEYIGEFWGFYETRPYMQLRAYYFNVLIENSMFRSAAAEGEDLLRLSENDNLGIRYHLMNIYAFLEDEQSAKKLYKKYDEKSTMFLLPLSILYYKSGDFKKSLEYLTELNRINKDTLKFFKAMKANSISQYLSFESSFGYKPFSIEELVIAVTDNEFLFFNIPQYFEWGLKKLNKNCGK